MGLIADVKSDLGKAEAIIEKWWAKAPDVETVVSTAVNIAGVALETVFTVEQNGPAASEVGAAVSVIQSKLAAGLTLVKTVGPTVTVKSFFAGIVSDIQGVESLLGVKNAASATAISTAATTIGNLVNSLPSSTVVADAKIAAPAAA